jgi:hypothetical protein
MRNVAFVLVLVSCAAGEAAAQSLAVRGGSSGFGAELGVGINTYLGVRASYGAGSYGYDTTEDGIRYDATLKPSIGTLTLDLHPFGGSFRLSAGLGLNRTRIDARAVPVGGTLTINDRVYNAADVGSVDAFIRFERSAPYFGFGWGAAAMSGRGLYFTSDVGVVLSRASGTLQGTCGASLNAAACAQLQADLQAEALSFKTEAEKLRFYPLITGGVGYRF